jgi:hypothetical protein
MNTGWQSGCTLYRHQFGSRDYISYAFEETEWHEHCGMSKFHPVTSSPTERINSSALLFWTTPGRKR